MCNSIANRLVSSALFLSGVSWPTKDSLTSFMVLIKILFWDFHELLNLVLILFLHTFPIVKLECFQSWNDNFINWNKAFTRFLGCILSKALWKLSMRTSLYFLSWFIRSSLWPTFWLIMLRFKWRFFNYNSSSNLVLQ